MKSNLRVLVFATLVLTIAGCHTLDTSGRDKAIEEALGSRYDFRLYQVGVVALDEATVAYMKEAEAAGLVTLRKVNKQFSWNDFLSQTQGGGVTFEVTATPKLLAIADDFPKPDASDNITAGVVRVKFQEVKIDKVVSEEEYRGPLSTLGEKHYLILGFYTCTRNLTKLKVLGVAERYLVPTVRFRFRAVVKYSEFDKKWYVVAVDAGAGPQDDSSGAWFSHSVR